MNRIWHKGPPPHVGWWNASLAQDEDCWRWWDGEEWSIASTKETSPEAADKRVSHKSTYSRLDMEWTDYWPEGARVPRIDPSKWKT